MAGYHLDRPYKLTRGKELSAREGASLKKYAGLVTDNDAALVSLGLDGHLWPGEEEKTKKLLKRAFEDERFRHAVEFRNKRKIDILHNFGSPVSDDEFKKAGFQGREYWSLWSKDDEGKIWMDADYYNAILDNNKITFTEENGKTVRTIEPIKEDK